MVWERICLPGKRLQGTRRGSDIRWLKNGGAQSGPYNGAKASFPDLTREARTNRRRKFWNLVINAVPLTVVIGVFTFFSFDHLTDQEYAATATNPLGLFTNNFVWDGSVNLALVLLR